jgi:ribosomal protein L28
MVGGYSNAVRATKYNHTGMQRKQPNLQWAALPAQAGGGRIKICTSCLKKNKHLEIKMI